MKRRCASGIYGANTTGVTDTMSVRRSTRIKIASSSSLPASVKQQQEQTASGTGGAPSKAPATKRRRKNGTASAHGAASLSATAGVARLTSAKPNHVVKQEEDVTRDPSCSSTNSSASASSVVLVPVPDDFSLAQAVCSYGYYLLPPNVWKTGQDVSNADSGTFSRPLRFGESLKHTAQSVISLAPGQPRGNVTLAVNVVAERKLTKCDEDDVRAQVVRMFRTTADLKAWFKLNEKAKKRHYGRLFRSPTLFEDMVKCITACNMKFGGTIRMNKLLCQEFGRNQAFPTPEDLLGVDVDDLRQRAKVGYRSDRILRLAQAFRDGTVDTAWLEEPERTRDEIFEYVKRLYGFGEFAARNVTMLLGFYDLVPMDSETVRHFKEAHKIVTKNVQEVAPLVKQHYDPYSPYQFLQYWFEMIQWYEAKLGKDRHTWDATDFPSYPL